MSTECIILLLPGILSCKKPLLIAAGVKVVVCMRKIAVTLFLVDDGFQESTS